MRQIDPKLCKQHFSAKIFKSYIYYLQQNHPEIDPRLICEEAGLPYEYLQQEDNWVSITFEKKFTDLVKRATRDRDIDYKVGLISLSKAIIGGPLYFLARNTLSLKGVYTSVPKMSPMFNKLMEVKLENVGPRSIEISYKFKTSELTEAEKYLLKEAEDDIISNTEGYFSGIPKIKDLGLARVQIDRHETGFNIIVEPPLELNILDWKFFGSIIAAFGLVHLIEWEMKGAWATWLLSFGAGVFAYIARKYLLVREASQETQTALIKVDTQYNEIQKVKLDLQRKLQEATVLNKIADSISKELTQKNILDKACQSLTRDLWYDRVIILLADDEAKTITYASSAGLDNDLLKLFRGYSLPTALDTDDPRKLTNVFRFGKPILISDVHLHIDALLPESRALLMASKSTSFICTCIETESGKYGLMIADCYHKEKVLGESDLQLLKTVGQQIAQSLERKRNKSREVEAFERANQFRDGVLGVTAAAMEKPLAIITDQLKVSDQGQTAAAIAALTELVDQIKNLKSTQDGLRKQSRQSHLHSSFPTNQVKRDPNRITRRGARILLVDDQDEARQQIETVLAEGDFQVRIASSGKEAIDLVLSGYRPDLILMDVIMPVVTGYDTATAIRKVLSRTEVPIVYLTNKSQMPDFEMGFNAGGNDFIDKPVQTNDLLAKIDTQLATASIGKAYARFVPWKTFDLLNYKSVLDVRIGDGIETEMTVLFCDIRNFTTLCENLTPSDILGFLNSYLACLSPVISENNGFIDSFIGDCIMAVFSTADDALKASRAMIAAVTAMNARAEFERFGRISVGIGINTGQLILGPIGYEGRLQITSISDSVNTASRVESLCKEFGATILLTELTLERLSKEIRTGFRLLGNVAVKGRSAPVRVFEDFSVQSLDLKYNKERTIKQFEDAVNTFLTGKTDLALALFHQLSTNSNDKAVHYYLERIEASQLADSKAKKVA